MSNGCPDHREEETTMMVQIEGPDRRIQVGRKVVGFAVVILQIPDS